MAKNKTLNRSQLQWMTTAALLTALIFLFTFTGIGYIPVGPLTLTILTLPVAVGGCLLGKWGGLFLGAMFGLSSFLTCFGIDFTGGILIGQNAFFTFITCMVPRLLCGFLPALLFEVLDKRDRTHVVSSSIACVSVAIINTVLFLGTMWLLFSDLWTGANPAYLDAVEAAGGTASPIPNIWAFFVSFAGINAIVEISANLILGPTIVKALLSAKKRMAI